LEETDTSNGIYTLQGAIDGFANDQTYNYSIKSINQSKGCESIEITGSLSVQKGHKLVRTQGSNNQTICEGEAIEPITFKFSEGAVSASPVNIPPGLDWIIDGDELLISGTPISTDVDELTIKTFVVESIGNSCTPDPKTVTISIEPDAGVSLESPAQTRIQDVCQGFAIEDITYSFSGGAVDVIWNGLPSGLVIEKVYDLIDPDKISRLDITGIPNIAVLTDTTFDYTIKALNSNGCNQQEQTGSITVKANAELSLLSTSLSENQTVCVGEDILPINIEYENSLPPSVSGMPAGLYTDNATPGVLKIRGQVDDLQLGNPNRTITVVGTNTNGCQSQEIIININVEPSFDIKPAIEVQNPLDVGNPSGASFVKNITCYDSNDGEILVNLEGGSSTTVYNYVWNGPNNYVNTTQNNHIKNLSKGTYIVEVEAKGARGCSITQTYTITEPEPINIIENEIRPVTCTGSEDGLISVTINGGNDNFYRNFIWEVLQENQSCTTYTIRLRDNDNDGIFDIIDADKNNDGILDEPGTDDNANGIIDDADNDTNYSFGIVRYQSCDGLDVKNNIIRGEFSANGIYQICAIPNTVSADATLDHDLDPSTQPIAPVTISGGTSSCSAGTWTKIDRLKGSSLASGLDEGIYRLTVVEGPDLNDIESNDLESLRNNPDMCIEERIFELPKDQILYGSVRVDDTYCSLSGGYIDIDVNQSAGDIYFIYDGVRVPSTDVEIIAAEFAINTYRVLIQNPNSNGSFEIRNATGCGVVVAQDLLDTNVITPIINYSSPELDKYGTISERSNVLFTLAGNTSYYRVEWDFGDASPIAAGERVSHQYFADGTYTVTVYVYNASGCFTSSTKEIIIGKGYTILMPNAFSPNGDNINEIIGPVFTGLKAVEFYIYNSQGILIYQELVSEDNLSPNGTIEIMGWDGENSDPSSNFYIYKIIGTRINEELVTRTGTIFLIE
jgi:PKD repeat protein